MYAACTMAGWTCPGHFTKKNPYIGPVGNGKTAGWTTNVMSYSYLNRCGVEAAMYAMQGYKGAGLNDNNAIASRYYTTGLGKEYQCMDMYFKPWPCCRKTHGAIGAALALKEEHGVKAEDIENIRIFQQTTGMYVNTPISTEMDLFGGQFSLQYTVSCVFLDGTVDLRHYRWPDRRIPQKYVDFSKKITVVADNGLDGHNAISPNHAIVEVTLNDGKVLSMYCKYPLGSEPNQMTDAQFEQKLRNCAEDMTTEQQDQLVKWIMSLDELEAM
jgi:2-methylcitrate dehydratase PrpD